LLRDYIQDIEAHLAVKADDFQVQQLSMWQELVAPKLNGPAVFKGVSAMDVEAAEEAATEAGYREIIARMAADEKMFVDWKLSASQAENRAHVVMVQHHRAQNAKGVQRTT
jgi:hypothetical protein